MFGELFNEVKREAQNVLNKAGVVVDAVWENRQRIIDAARRTPHVCVHASEIVLDVVSDAVNRLHKKVMQCTSCGCKREESTPMPPVDPSAA